MADAAARRFCSLQVQVPTTGGTVSKAMKLALKELPKLGCVLLYKDDRTATFRLASGATWTCSARTQMHTVRSVIAHQRPAYRAATGLVFEAWPDFVGAPRLEIGDFEASPHFKDRLALMRGQGLAYPEVVGALLAPDVVKRMPDTGRLLYCGGRVGVVVDPVDGGYGLITVLWATDELWEQNPRPERLGR